MAKRSDLDSLLASTRSGPKGRARKTKAHSHADLDSVFGGPKAKPSRSESTRDFLLRIGAAVQRKDADTGRVRTVVKPHPRARKSCASCRKNHDTSQCVSHGPGSFKRAHPGTRGGRSG